ncbi:pyridoxamine 5'-phosphate oxidase family protein [Natronolimnohabitans sp. A-GB9]|uniref:pyridoxamine 5'-phosphate oxidase family protein n=1 Tax=Natronolimnohabitans sp. A-GB9 TaxID=3069757 RepID=UPI0027B40A05|nr:pyridoxamine 5'-phosphate oxidase family protein [Natronolimnohabitans sp. A-GB9]MDQ2052097.1 pyridoxamine 5'-phosphate oxidase family protein [Natronolimnohabitans sp. A-GB9]
MDRIEYVYTVGMKDEEVEGYLESVDTGVLALASAGDAYAIPVAHHYDDEGSIYIRLSADKSSTKLSYLEDTDTACLTLYDVDESGDSWSIIATGPLRKLSGDERETFDATAVNESFLQLRVFDEDIEAIDLEIYELEIETLTGRKTGN